MQFFLELAAFSAQVRPAHASAQYLIISALSYNPHTNLHINKSREA
jgi:hypothetical protein